MKKTTVIFAGILLGMFCKQTHAQPAISSDQEEAIHSIYPNSGFYGGVRAAPQMSWMANMDDKDNSSYETLSKFGAAFGLAGGYNFDDHLGIELNGIYSFEGKRYKISGKEYTQKLNYIKIPVLFTYTTRPSSLMFLGKIGPQLHILNTAKVDPAIANGTLVSDNKDQFEGYVLGGVASAGIRYAATDRIWIDASLRYDLTFTKVEDKDYKFFPSGRADTHNMTAGIELGVNYLFK